MKKKFYSILAMLALGAMPVLSQVTTFNFTGGIQTFTVPCGVNSVFIQSWGGQGGSGAPGGNSVAGGPGGLGGYAEGFLTVNPGDVLNVFVGGQGATPAGGFNGGANGGSQNAGGGGGASDVRVGGTAEVNRVITAGGGGGGGRGGCHEGSGVGGVGGDGGIGGGGAGVNGFDSPQSSGVAGGGRGGNFGAVQGAAGAAGIGCSGFLGAPGSSASTGTGGTGGAGQTCCCSSSNSVVGGGGGGGGQLGGGGGGGGSAGTTGCAGNSKGAGGGGGGGSSYIGGVTSGVVTNGIWLGNGQVTITWSDPIPPAHTITGSGSFCQNDSATYTISSDPYSTVYTWTVPVGLTLLSGQNTTSISVAGATAGTYMIYVQGVNATCSLSGPTDSIMVTVNAAPGVVATAASGSICIGSSDTLNANGAVSYLWNPGSMTSATVIVAPLATTTYTLVGTDSLGCSNTTTVTVTVNNLPTVTLTTTSPVCLADGASTLSGGSPSGGTYSGPGVSAGMFTPSTAGIGTHAISYVFTDGNGCTSSDSSSIVVDACLGISQIIPVGSVGVTPNPATELINVSWNANQKVTSITIMDVTGRVVMIEAAANMTSKQIDVKNLPAGTYTIAIDGVSGKATQTFVKQ